MLDAPYRKRDAYTYQRVLIEQMQRRRSVARQQPVELTKQKKSHTFEYISCTTVSESSQWHAISALQHRAAFNIHCCCVGGGDYSTDRPPCPRFSLICVKTMYLLRMYTGLEMPDALWAPDTHNPVD